MRISRNSNSPLAPAQWVVRGVTVTSGYEVSGYTIAFAALLLSAGALSDRLGSRRVFLAGMVLFDASSLGCALSSSVLSLIVWRAAQGVAAAMLVPSAPALLHCLWQRQAAASPIRRYLGGHVHDSAHPVDGGSVQCRSESGRNGHRCVEHGTPDRSGRRCRDLWQLSRGGLSRGPSQRLADHHHFVGRTAVDRDGDGVPSALPGVRRRFAY